MRKMLTLVVLVAFFCTGASWAWAYDGEPAARYPSDAKWSFFSVAAVITGVLFGAEMYKGYKEESWYREIKVQKMAYETYLEMWKKKVEFEKKYNVKLAPPPTPAINKVDYQPQYQPQAREYRSLSSPAIYTPTSQISVVGVSVSSVSSSRLPTLKQIREFAEERSRETGIKYIVEPAW